METSQAAGLAQVAAREREARAPTLKPGVYRRPGSDRWWRHDELAVVWYGGQWCIVPVVALAAVPEAQE